SSNVCPSSRRKSSLLTSEHLLDREVVSKPPGRAVDARLGRGLRYAERPRQLFERKVEIEMQDERQTLVGGQPKQRPLEVGVAFWFFCCWTLHVRELDHRPPPGPPRHPALVGHDGEKPWPERGGIAAKLLHLAPRLDRGLLDGVFGG